MCNSACGNALDEYSNFPRPPQVRSESVDAVSVSEESLPRRFVIQNSYAYYQTYMHNAKHICGFQNATKLAWLHNANTYEARNIKHKRGFQNTEQGLQTYKQNLHYIF